jgi:hypothetical protein
MAKATKKFNRSGIAAANAAELTAVLNGGNQRLARSTGAVRERRLEYSFPRASALLINGWLGQPERKGERETLAVA